MRARSLAWLAVAAAAACATPRATGAPPGLAVVALGEARVLPALRAALASRAELPVAVRVVELPARFDGAADNVADTADVEARLVRARAAYVDADFAACERELPDDGRVVALLGAGQQRLAARALFWRTACRGGAHLTVAAEQSARALATWGLEPPDVVVAAPEVDALLADVGRRVAAMGLRPARFVAPGREPARVAIDGRAPACATPCTLDLVPGDHVVRFEADGFEPEVRLFRVEDRGADVVARAVAASPALAARQWAAGYEGSPRVDSAASMRLLASALRAPRLALVAVDGAGAAARTRGTLAVRGDVVARAERRAATSAEVRGLLRDLLVRGHVIEPAPPLVAQPVFWIVLGLAAAASAALTATAVLYPRPIAITVGWR